MEEHLLDQSNPVRTVTPLLHDHGAARYLAGSALELMVGEIVQFEDIPFEGLCNESADPPPLQAVTEYLGYQQVHLSDSLHVYRVQDFENYEPPDGDEIEMSVRA